MLIAFFPPNIKINTSLITYLKVLLFYPKLSRARTWANTGLGQRQMVAADLRSAALFPMIWISWLHPLSYNLEPGHPEMVNYFLKFWKSKSKDKERNILCGCVNTVVHLITGHWESEWWVIVPGGQPHWTVIRGVASLSGCWIVPDRDLPRL